MVNSLPKIHCGVLQSRCFCFLSLHFAHCGLNGKYPSSKDRGDQGHGKRSEPPWEPHGQMMQSLLHEPKHHLQIWWLWSAIQLNGSKMDHQVPDLASIHNIGRNFMILHNVRGWQHEMHSTAEVCSRWEGLCLGSTTHQICGHCIYKNNQQKLWERLNWQQGKDPKARPNSVEWLQEFTTYT